MIYDDKKAMIVMERMITSKGKQQTSSFVVFDGHQMEAAIPTRIHSYVPIIYYVGHHIHSIIVVWMMMWRMEWIK
jgi:hypothetical protein